MGVAMKGRPWCVCTQGAHVLACAAAGTQQHMVVSQADRQLALEGCTPRLNVCVGWGGGLSVCARWCLVECVRMCLQAADSLWGEARRLTHPAPCMPCVHFWEPRAYYLLDARIVPLTWSGSTRQLLEWWQGARWQQ
jgi:hypothetical protein